MMLCIHFNSAVSLDFNNTCSHIMYNCIISYIFIRTSTYNTLMLLTVLLFKIGCSYMCCNILRL